MPDPTPPKPNEPSPPAAPPSAPPTPPAAPPATPPTPPAEPPKPFRTIGEDLEALGSPSDPPKPPGEPPAPPEEPPAPPAEPPAEPPQTPPEGDDDYLGVPKPKDEPKPPGKPEDPPTGPLKAPELRAEYAKVKQRLADAEKEIEAYKTGGKPLDEDEKKTYLTEIEGLKKKLSEADGTIKSVAYEQSREYQQKYEKPFVDAWQEGVQLIEGFSLTDQDGNQRKGTADDFAAIMQIADNEQAANVAQEMFGVNAVYVLGQRRDIQRLHGQRVRALEEFRSNLSEREKQQLETHQKQVEQREAARLQNVTLFKKLNTEAAEKYPELFAPIDGDEEGNALLTKGFKDADLAFSGAPDMPNDRRVRLHSAIRNRAAAFSRLVHQLKSKDAEIAAIKAELDEIKGSTPGDGQEGRERDKDGKFRRPTADEDLEAVAKYQ